MQQNVSFDTFSSWPCFLENRDSDYFYLRRKPTRAGLNQNEFSNDCKEFEPVEMAPRVGFEPTTLRLQVSPMFP